MDPEVIEQNFEPTGDEVDQLLNGMDSPEEGIPMGDEEVIKTAPQEAAKFTFKADGKDVEATQEQLIKWAQQGYGAPQKIGELNDKLKGYEQDDSLKSYKEIDNWAKENPEQWQHIQEQYQARDQQVNDQLPTEMQEALAPIMQELEGLRDFKNQYENKQIEQKTQAEDQALETEMKSIRDTYKDLDFDTPDDSGKSLEYKVMEHAAENGITSFKTAFLDFNHDRLMKIAEQRGKESVIQERKSRNKLGLLEVSAPTETTEFSSYNPVESSEDANFAAALRELTG